MEFPKINKQKIFAINKKNDNVQLFQNRSVDLKSLVCLGGVSAGLLGVLKSTIQIPNSQNDIIKKKLDEIEKKHNIKIIYACEVGSKAWGSDSKNSDYDIRYIYISPKSHYLNKVNNDTIKDELNDEFDIYGYDISKILESLKKQNYNIYEWINSPIKYKTSITSEQLEQITSEHLTPQDLFQSYLNLSKNNYIQLIKKREIVDIKSYLLVLKTLLMSEYISNTGKFPPLNMQEIFNIQLNDNEDIREIANQLLLNKKNSPKKIAIEHIPVLESFIESKLSILNKKQLNREPQVNNDIDAFFNKTINSGQFDDINKIKLSAIEQKRLDTFEKDIDYKKQLLKSLDISPEEHLTLRSIVGPQEFEYILKKYNNTPEIYSTNAVVDSTGKEKLQNVIDKKFRANLHIHTIHSDGKLSVQKLLDSAVKYADKLAKKIERNNIEDFEPFTIAITDHNTTEGCKEAVRIIQNNPEKYKNLRVVLGIELSATEKEVNGYIPKKPYQIHLLAQNINPFDEELNTKLERKVNAANPNYTTLGDMKSVVSLLDSQPYVTLGYAHPLEGHSYKKTPSNKGLSNIIYSLIKRFKNISKEHVCYIENYYQSYTNDIGKDKNLKLNVYQFSENHGLLSSGGMDTHGDSIFHG